MGAGGLVVSLVVSMLLVVSTSLVASIAALPARAQVEQERDVGRTQESPARADGERTAKLDRQFRRAQTAWRTGASLFEAKARLDRVLHALPSDTAARKLRAEVLLEMGRPEEALEDARRAAELQPEDGEAHLLHAEAARESSRFEEARRALEKASEHLPRNAVLHTRFSWNAMLLDRLAQAEAFGRVALALDSTSAPAYRQLARVFMQRERTDEAAAVLARGLQAGRVQPRSVREDELLRQLTDHPRLKEWMRP